VRQRFPQTHEEKLAYLRELREQAIHSASEEAVEKQHAKGKLTARERIEKLLDPGSFEELDTFVRHRTYEFGMEKRRPWGDAVVTGYGTIDGLRADPRGGAAARDRQALRPELAPRTTPERALP
jgi:propionyl-CoA carboxylase beta chain